MMLKKTTIKSGLILVLTLIAVFATQMIVYAVTFTNPIKNPGADPWVVYKDGYYYYCGSNGDNQIYVWKSADLTTIGSAPMITVWTAPETGMNSHQIWAPELHYINGKWYIYYCASDGNNANHRMWVLEGTSQDPQGPYISKGKLYDPTDKWAIDGTVLQKDDGSLYLVWSGWPGDTDGQQNLYIAPMSNPYTISGNRVCISTPTYDWETRPMALNEGPQIIKKNGKIFIVYSASGSWTVNYCLGMLTCSDGNVLNPASWSKTGPVFAKYSDVYGVGHASFVKSPDGTEDWIVYHAKTSTVDGWDDRNIRTQKFRFNDDGSPDFGYPISTGIALEKPSTDEVADPDYKGWGDSYSGVAMTGSWTRTSETSSSGTSLGAGWMQVFRGNPNYENYAFTFQAQWVQTGTTSAYPKYGAYVCYKDGDNYNIREY